MPNFLISASWLSMKVSILWCFSSSDNSSSFFGLLIIYTGWIEIRHFDLQSKPRPFGWTSNHDTKSLPHYFLKWIMHNCTQSERALKLLAMKISTYPECKLYLPFSRIHPLTVCPHSRESAKNATIATRNNRTTATKKPWTTYSFFLCQLCLLSLEVLFLLLQLFHLHLQLLRFPFILKTTPIVVTTDQHPLFKGLLDEAYGPLYPVSRPQPYS